MKTSLRGTLVEGGRSALRRVAAGRGRRAVERLAHELNVALDSVYGARYYGCGAKQGAAGLVSGYGIYNRHSSNADIAAYLLWRFLPVRRTLDVGCALGFLVEALRDVAIDAEGVDVSQYAVDHATPGARGHLHRADLAHGLRFDDGAFDTVTALETLEHMPPQAVPGAIRELRRLTRGFLVCSIPSFGPNAGGPAGWLEGKVRPERVQAYAALGNAYEGPVPYDDLARDADGEPVEGHLCIASFSWWTRRFEEAGFERRLDLERRMIPVVREFGLQDAWNLYVLAIPGTPEPVDPLRNDDELAWAERQLRLHDRRVHAAGESEAVVQ